MKTNTVTVHICTCGTVRHSTGIALVEQELQRIGLRNCPRHPAVDFFHADIEPSGLVYCTKNRPQRFDGGGYVILKGNPKPLRLDGVFHHDLKVERSPFRRVVYKAGHNFVQVWHVPQGHHLRFSTNKEWRVYMVNGLMTIQERGVQLAKAQEDNKRGRLAEDMFLKAWVRDPIWRANRATPKEDLEQATDAWLTSVRDPWCKYRIQVKAGNGYDVGKFAQQGLVLVTIDVARNRYVDIRSKTYRALQIFHRINPRHFGGRRPRHLLS